MHIDSSAKVMCLVQSRICNVNYVVHYLTVKYSWVKVVT